VSEPGGEVEQLRLLRTNFRRIEQREWWLWQERLSSLYPDDWPGLFLLLMLTFIKICIPWMGCRWWLEADGLSLLFDCNDLSAPTDPSNPS